MIDLHVHSTFSDGSLTPEQLLQEADRLHLAALALTDHDSVDGVARLLAAGRAGRARPIPGVEISVESPAGPMHMLGYFIDPACASLSDRLGRIQAGRAERNRRIIEQLGKMGMALDMAEIAALAGGEVVGRPHFAQAMVARGYVRSAQEAFDRFLAKGKPAYQERLRLDEQQAIAMIRDAGGVAVLAHPFTLGLGKAALDELVVRLCALGLQGIEVYYPKHTKKQVRQYLAAAARHGLAVTGGTDFHGAAAPDIKMGVGFGDMRVPDDLVAELERRARC